MEYALPLIIGAICGSVLLWILSRRKIRHLETQVKTESEGRIVAETKLEEQQKTAEEKLALWEDAEQKLSNVFKALSGEALKSNSTQFLELAKTDLEKYQEGAKADLEKRQIAIDEIVKPLKESLKNVDDNIAEIEKERTSAYSGLIERVRSIAATEEKLQAETAKLVTALRTPSGKGVWGQMQLKNVVELAGMTSYCDFKEQKSITAEGERLQPDMVVRLPRQRNIVVDSKVPLKAYLEAIEADSEEKRQLKLKEHAAQVKTHISNLGAKGYWEQFQPGPEWVVLFLPGEVFFGAALQQDPSLTQFGLQKRVLLASPTTLIAILLGIAYDWRQEQIAENAHIISELGKELYKRVGTLAEHFHDMRAGLNSAVEAYNKAVGSFESRVLVTARRFRELGAATGDEIQTLQTVDTTTRMIQGGRLGGTESEEKQAGTPPLNKQTPSETGDK